MLRYPPALLLLLFCFCVKAQVSDSLQLKNYTEKELYKDYDLLINSLKEAHTGLYWYNSKMAFNHFARTQRAQIRPGMTGLDLYRIIAPVVSFTKEGHTSLKLSQAVQDYLRVSALYLPAFIKIIHGRLYLINDLPGAETRGCELLGINGLKANNLLRRFMSYEPSDGYNVTGKYRWIEEGAKFNLYYARCYPKVKSFTFRYRRQDGTVEQLAGIPPLSFTELRHNYTAALKTIPNSIVSIPASLTIDSGEHTAVLSFNTFQKRRYTTAKMDFKAFVQQSFSRISASRVNNLIIDIRRNGGGTEGYEDYLLSFMISKDYVKYETVQASAFHYSFYSDTDYRNGWLGLDSALKAEHYLAGDGRILRKPGIEEHEKPQPAPYTGRIFVLTSGLTYSGGSEFGSLMRNYTPAVFIGEETGGGYYGNTSGYRISLQLPNTGLEISIPILKFVVSTPKKGNPVGRGVMPDLAVEPTIRQYLEGVDPELGTAKKLSAEKH
ncbi:MAG: S41 family peptidase [Bacteroidota bacterium]